MIKIPEYSGFCLNSRRWVFKMLLWLPKRCVFRQEGEIDCVYEKCSYFENRKLTYCARKQYEVMLSIQEEWRSRR